MSVVHFAGAGACAAAQASTSILGFSGTSGALDTGIPNDAQLLFQPNGQIDDYLLNGGGSHTDVGRWTTGSLTTGLGNDYEIKATLSAGDTPSGPALGSWHTLDSVRAWSHSGSSVKSSDLLIEIREIADTSNIISKTFNIIVETGE